MNSAYDTLKYIAIQLQWKALISAEDDYDPYILFENAIKTAYNKCNNKILIVTDTTYQRNYYKGLTTHDINARISGNTRIECVTFDDFILNYLNNVDLLLIDAQVLDHTILHTMLNHPAITRYIAIVRKLEDSSGITDIRHEYNYYMPLTKEHVKHYAIKVDMGKDDLSRYIKYATFTSTTFRLLSQIIAEAQIRMQDYHLTQYDLLNAAVRGYNKNDVHYLPREVCRIIASIKGWKPTMDFEDPKYQSIISKYHPDRIQEICETTLHYIGYKNDVLENNVDKSQKVHSIIKISPYVRALVLHKHTVNAELLVKRFESVYPNYYYKALPYCNTLESRELINWETNNLYTNKSGTPVKLGTRKLLKLGLYLMQINRLQVLSSTVKLKPEYYSDVINTCIIVGIDSKLSTMFTRASAVDSIFNAKPLNKLNGLKVVVWLYFDDCKADDGQPIRSKDVSELTKIQSTLENINIVPLNSIMGYNHEFIQVLTSFDKNVDKNSNLFT